MTAPQEQVDPAEHESWDAFWSEVKRAKPVEVIRGVTVEIPTDLPLSFARRLDDLSDSDKEEDFQALVSELFGHDVYDQWVDAGMGVLEFQVVLTWALASGTGKPISFREAYDVVTQGKGPDRLAPNRAQRRRKNASKRASKGTGGP